MCFKKEDPTNDGGGKCILLSRNSLLDAFFDLGTRYPLVLLGFLCFCLVFGGAPPPPYGKCARRLLFHWFCLVFLWLSLLFGGAPPRPCGNVRAGCFSICFAWFSFGDARKTKQHQRNQKEKQARPKKKGNT